MKITRIDTNNAPKPAGPYSQAICARGDMLFLSGQTPRTLEGRRMGNIPFREQAKLALDNLEAVAKAAGLSLKHAVNVHVYLRNLKYKMEFDSIYANYIGDPPPARTLVQSTFIDFDIEVEAVLLSQ